MADPGIGHELAALTHEAEAESDIDVFMVAEISLIEPASFEEQRARIEGSRTARTEALAWRKRSRRVVAKASTPGIAIGEIIIPCSVELRRVMEVDLQ